MDVFIHRSEQTFEERLVKMARFMTVDVHRELVEGLKNEKLLQNVLALLKHFYKTKSTINRAEIDTENISLKRKEPKVSITICNLINVHIPLILI